MDQFLLDKHEKIRNPTVREAAYHIITAGGKRLRPTLLLLSCECIGGGHNVALPAAAAVEVLHTFSIVHDGIIDHDELRRGIPTVHAKWESIGILTGDSLLGFSFELLGELDIRYEVKQVLTMSLFHTLQAMIDGEVRDIEFESKKLVNESEYLEMLNRKTGSLFEYCGKAGAMIGLNSMEETDHVRILSFTVD